MIDIEKIAKESIYNLKNDFDNFPKSGIIAGGSLANLIWDKVSGNKTVINDIDVFLFNRKLDKKDLLPMSTITSDDKKVFYKKSNEKCQHDEYSGIHKIYTTNEYYVLDETESDGIYNYIKYSGTSNNIKGLISTFDINCTQVGYDIENDKIYWTNHFEDFINSGDLKITDLSTPNHTAIRIVKKKQELNANLDENELLMCAYVIKNMHDMTRTYFTDKYFKTYFKYKDILGKYFSLMHDQGATMLIKKRKNKNINCYRLISNITSEESNLFLDFGKSNLASCRSFLFYCRNIVNDLYNYKIWSKLKEFYISEDYVDVELQDSDINKIEGVLKYLPGSINGLIGKKLSEQSSIINRLFNAFKDDNINIAFAALESENIINLLSSKPSLDNGDLLLIELSVRLSISNKVYNTDSILNSYSKTTF